MKNYFLFIIITVSLPLYGAEQYGAQELPVKFLFEKMLNFLGKDGIRLVNQEGAAIPPAPAFQKNITENSVRYTFNGTLPECLMAFLFVKNEAGKIHVSKAIRASGSSVASLSDRLQQLLQDHSRFNKQMFYIAPIACRGNKCLTRLEEQSNGTTVVQSCYYPVDIIHPAGYVQYDGSSIDYEVHEALETSAIKSFLKRNE